jgi:hypothetical protein
MWIFSDTEYWCPGCMLHPEHLDSTVSAAGTEVPTTDGSQQMRRTKSIVNDAQPGGANTTRTLSEPKLSEQRQQ